METLEERIMRHEGFTATPKPDAKGMYEIGYGHDLTEEQCKAYPDGITEPDARSLLEKDMAAVKAAADKAFPWLSALTENRQGVIYEMCYQMGVAGVAEFRQMIAAIQEPDWFRVGDEMLRSEWDKETPGRCASLANIMVLG